MYIYCNSQFIKDSEATISPFDHGFLYGLGAFETFRVYKGFPFLLHDHLKRLQNAINELGISYKIDADEVVEMIQHLLRLNHCEEEDVTVRYNISAGNGEVGKLLQPYDSPTVLCFLRKAPMIQRVEKDAAILQLRRNTPEGKERLKSHHYLNNVLGKRELRETPDVEGIFLTEQGYVAEGIVSNVFWVKDDIVYTPSVETGILNGITRRFIIKGLENLNIPLREGFYTQGDLLDATEVMITNSSQEVIPVKRVRDATFLGNEGIIVRQLRDLFDCYRTKLLSIDEL
ncbi:MULTISPECIES: aminodeoxychorismate lyase [Metabacillus]|uniref:Aminodeoxychorismate lyase n=1 Tax=Metabacillus rhizolycopersici TaxID=2875709 RepID=A0ABS7UTA4_9BACI|nr:MULTISPECIES: aminodeoxychorismate lyase [Metabacillus]MBZ5751195.1 aminodeoxychorismate lyase [Metabacillus rhizolycopersici]MCM3655062.1 aminodeoxychorismate lyase [Metabacillus litoralis]